MSTPVEKVSEPVRKWIYSILVTLGAVGVFYGVVSGEEVAVWLSVAHTVLVVPFVEVARTRVRPLAKGNAHGQSPTW
jgi:hypothetical protein